MARPTQNKQLEATPHPVIYMPAGWTQRNVPASEIEVEDFEAFRLVDGEGLNLEQVAARMGCSKSTVGRMVERARRILARALYAKAPICIDAGEDSNFTAKPGAFEGHGELAVAVDADRDEASVSGVFGRAPFFAVYEKSKVRVFLANPGENRKRSAAKAAVDVLAKAGITGVAAGRFGPDALMHLAEAGIKPTLISGLSLSQFEELCLRKSIL
jgi:predicted DNA-binding protein (UPF0251 family)/predicted Fe-Mo cluster-binding NifX family protein